LHLYLILKISNYIEFASLLEIYTFLTYKKDDISKNEIVSTSQLSLSDSVIFPS